MRARWTTRAFIRGELSLCILCRLPSVPTGEFPFVCKSCCAKSLSPQDQMEIIEAGRRLGMKWLEQKEAKEVKNLNPWNP